jgi:hypothetical protein
VPICAGNKLHGVIYYIANSILRVAYSCVYLVAGWVFQRLVLYAIQDRRINENQKLEKKELVDIIDKEFKPLGFKRKGNYWQLNGKEIIKLINLQTSSFSKLYYINYGFNFVNLGYDGTSMHVFKGLGSLDKQEQELIKNLLDFESNIDDETRRNKLTKIIRNILKVELNKINAEKDVLKEIEEKPILLNMLPLKVKEYLKLSE